MKTTKKIFVCLLTVVVALSAFALSASAEGNTYTPDNLADVLEYYTESEMMYLDFEDAAVGDYTDGIFNDKSGQSSQVVSDDAGKHLVLTGGRNAISSGSMFVTWNGDESFDDFALSVKLMTTDTATTNKSNRLVVTVNDAKVTNEQHTTAQSNGVVVGTELVCFDFVSGTVVYYDPSSIEKTSVLKNTDGSSFTVREGEYYVLDVFYSADGTYSLKVTAENGAYARVEGVTSPYASVMNLCIGEVKSSMASTTVHLDDIFACGGTYIKDYANKTVDSESALLTIGELCDGENELAPEMKVSLVEVGRSLISLGYTTDKPEVQAVINKLPVYTITIYSDLVAECVANINNTAPYAERVLNVETYKKYYDAIPEDLSAADDALRQYVLDAVAAYDAEVLALENIKLNSDEYIAIVAEMDLGDIANTENYEYLKAFFDRISVLNPYDGYEGVPEARVTGDMLVGLYNDMDTSARLFMENLGVATDLDNGFRVRYDAYFAAKEAYFDNETYPGITNALDSYAELDAEMLAAIALCRGFIEDVSSADYSQYITAKEQSLASAAAVLDEINEKYLEYPEITDYVELYEKLIVEVETNRAAADSYISCINALRADVEAGELSGEALWERIAEAVELQKTGNVSGVVGITDANIFLNDIKSEFELSAGYSTQFDVLVGKLDVEKDAATRYSIILNAYEAEANAENYDGVSSATKAKLDAAAADYNATVNAINATFTSVNTTACNVVSATAGASGADVGRVVALIKKFYE